MPITPEDQDKAVSALAALNSAENNAAPPVAIPSPAPVSEAPPLSLSANANPLPLTVSGPFNATAPEHLNPAPLTPANVDAPQTPIQTQASAAKQVITSPATPPPLVSVSSANPLSGPEGKDARANEITAGFDNKKAQLESQLAVERSQVESGSTTGNPTRVAALEAQLKLVDSQKADALRGNESAFGMYKKDENGDYHLDSNAIPKNLSPTQVAAWKARNAVVEQKNQDNAFGRQRTAIDAETNARAAAADVQAAGAQKVATQMQADAIDTHNKSVTQQAQLAQRQAEADKAVKDYNASSIDENEFWHKTPAGAQIGLAIMAGLTGAFNGLNHIQGNSVVDRVNQVIANNIDEQKVNLAKAGKNVELKNNAVQAFRQQGYDNAQADALAKASLLDATKTQVAATAAQYQNPIAQAQAQQLIAQLDQQRDQQRAIALQPYVDGQIRANQVVATGIGQKGFSPAVLNNGVWQVKNLATGKITEATGEQVAQAKGLEKTDAETNKLNNAAGSAGKVSPRIATKLAEHDHAIDAVTNFQNAYDKGIGLNSGIFDPEYQQQRKSAAEALSKVNGKPIAENEHDLSESHIGPRLKVITNDLVKSRERLVGEAKNSGVEGVQGENGEQ